MVSVKALCNSVLKKAFDEDIKVSPMKLQKLLYFIYKDFLNETGKQLFEESFLAWKYGPVLSSLYEEFKSFRSNSITRFARDAKGKVYIIDEKANAQIANSINKVWQKYKKYSGIELSEMTHQQGTAWDKAYYSGRTHIKFEDIANETI